ncbi:DMT family transporter [Arthrobacter sp. NPDC056727]|uniref:DMT family transporter n=1 Tax=Arthrobacter sp. NPDC056727 TaxID=3345927 RepID=UPI003671CCCC
MTTPPSTEQRSPTTTSWVVAGLSAAFIIAWSSGFIGSRLGTQTSTTLNLLSWRLVVLCPVAVIILSVTTKPKPNTSRRMPAGWKQQVLVGLLTQVISTWGAVAAIEYGVGVGTAAVIAALQPMITGAFASLVLKESVKKQEWLGLGVGLVGVALAVSGDLGAGMAPWWAYLLPFFGMLALVAATLIEARRPSQRPIAERLSIQVLVGAIVFGAVAVFTGQFVGPHLSESLFWMTVAWYVVFSITGGYTLYWVVLRRTSATRVGALIYLTPPTAAVWAWLMFGDTLNGITVIGFAVVALGVGLVFLHSSRTANTDVEQTRGKAPVG